MKHKISFLLAMLICISLLVASALPTVMASDKRTEQEKVEIDLNYVEQAALEEFIITSVATGKIERDEIEAIRNKLIADGRTDPEELEIVVNAVVKARTAKEEIQQTMKEQGMDPDYYAPARAEVAEETEVENYEVVKDNSVEVEQIKLEEFIIASVATGKIERDEIEAIRNKLIADGRTDPEELEIIVNAVVNARTAKEEIQQAMKEQGMNPDYYVPARAEVADTDVLITDLTDLVIWQDVAENDWFFDAVEYSYIVGLMNGVGDDCFAPQEEVSRAMAATVLYRLAECPAPETAPEFTDVEAEKWYSDGIHWAASEGIAEGYGNNKFGPDDPVTREQLVTMFWRAQGKPVANAQVLSAYSDAAEISPWAEDAFAWAVSNDLIQGKPGNILDPTGTTSRAQLATILMRTNESN